jgi:uncharacterized protein (TIGR00730 family)
MSEPHENISINNAINDLIKLFGIPPDSYEGDIIAEMIENNLKLIRDKHPTSQLKLIMRAMKEMRYAYRIFNQYPGVRRLSIFGSARTPEDHPDYIVAKEFSSKISDLGWMCITGAANGIMKAGHEGSKKEARFGLAIRLAFESSTNSVIEGDPKLINFRYFFTRKLMFLSHSDAVAVFPGGVGTQDELFEVLTLMQTGKSNIIPLVLLEGKGGRYWKNWEKYINENLLKNHWISPEDKYLYYHAKNVDDAVKYIQNFYYRYHSSRYVRDLLVIRMNSPLAPEYIESLNHDFAKLVKTGKIEQRSALPEEDDFLDLPRLTFVHNRRDYSLLKLLIDAINRVK